MKALRLIRPGQVTVDDVDTPALPAGHLLVRTAAAVICTSDLNDIRSNPFGIPLPVTLGHEGAGVVVAVADDVRGFAVGDRVAAHPVHPCRRCDACRAGMGHLCGAMGHFGINLPGTFATHFIVRTDRARKAGDLPMPLAALAEPVCVCLQALAQAAGQPGERLLILGDGPFGAMLAILAAAQGFAEVVVAGHHDFRLGFATGATTINLADGDGPGRLKAVAGAMGFDRAILAVGSASAVATALDCLRPKGRLVVFSAVHQPEPLNLVAVHTRELEIVGACNDEDRLDEAIDLLRLQAGPLSRLITHTFGLDEYREALDLAEHGRETAMKVAFTFDGAEAGA
ncbi:MAG: alcohol dehydrogenase catalytic domain-containing protein [Planctomycetes bacterium]|nr:alcohol dehydrogenase catalytic domain-containing protein [Planctomycetota bacterium]